MKRYGIIRPITSQAIACAKSGGRILRAIYEQRRLRVGENAKIAHDVRFVGGGTVVVGDRATISPGVLFNAHEGAIIEIGHGSYIGADCYLEARAGQGISLGRRFQLGPRTQVVSERGITLGDDGSFGYESFVGPREDRPAGSLVVGSASHFQNHTLIDLCADVIFGDNVRTGPFCCFYTHNHVPTIGRLIWDQSPVFAPISVRSGVWIGHHCCVLPGVSIGESSTIAAGAVVTKSLDEWVIAGGVPARVLKIVAE